MKGQEANKRQTELRNAMSIAEVATTYGKKPITIQKHIERGKIPAHKSENVWLIHRLDADEKYGDKK